MSFSTEIRFNKKLLCRAVRAAGGDGLRPAELFRPAAVRRHFQLRDAPGTVGTTNGLRCHDRRFQHATVRLRMRISSILPAPRPVVRQFLLSSNALRGPGLPTDSPALGVKNGIKRHDQRFRLCYYRRSTDGVFLRAADGVFVALGGQFFNVVTFQDNWNSNGRRS